MEVSPASQRPSFRSTRSGLTNQNRTSNAVEVSSQGAAIQLSFVDGDQGWASLTDRFARHLGRRQNLGRCYPRQTGAWFCGGAAVVDTPIVWQEPR